MERRDIIKDQIEQAGKVLGKLSALLLDTDNNTNIIEVYNQQVALIKDRLKINLDALLHLEKKEIQEKLSEEIGFNATNLQILSKSIYERYRLAQSKELDFLNLAYTLLQVADERSETYSMERKRDLEQIKTEISNYGI